jgi:hypothetical protein
MNFFEQRARISTRYYIARLASRWAAEAFGRPLDRIVTAEKSIFSDNVSAV